MNCFTCGKSTRILEKRDDRRRRECVNGHRFTTKDIDGKEVIFVSKRNVQEPEPTGFSKEFPLSKLWH